MSPKKLASDRTREVWDIFLSTTLYDASNILWESRLVDDLGVDSVMVEEIFAAAEQKFDIKIESEPQPVTVRDLIMRVTGTDMAVGEELFQQVSVEPAEPAPTPPGSGSVKDVAEPADSTWDGLSMRDFADLPDRDLFAKVAAFTEHRRGREEQHLYWYGMPTQSRSSNRVVIRDEQTGRTREYLMFASNNYLGLANDARVRRAIAAAADEWGATNTGCRIIGGTTQLHLELERRLARWKGREAAILFPGGYAANLGTISALVHGGDTVILDEYNHMSIVDGARLSGGRRRAFKHNDLESLENQLRNNRGTGGCLIVVDGVFSMHGDIAKIPGIVSLAAQYDAKVMVDDAHATGVLGFTGAGTGEHFGLSSEIDLEMGTLSKALAGIGGFVVGDQDVIDYLRFYADSYVFAATIPAPVVAGLIAALDVIELEPERLGVLWRNITALRQSLSTAGFDLGGTESAVIPVVVHDDQLALRLGREVRERGLFCQTVVYPGVGLGDARLRISVTSEHTLEDIAEAADIVEQAAGAVGL